MEDYIPVLYAIISSLGFGASDFFGGYAAKKQPTIRVLLLAAPASLLVELIAWPLFGAQYDSQSIIWGLLAGIAYSVGFALLYWCLAQGPVIILSPISAIVSAILPIITGLLLGETLTLSADCGLVLGMGAVALLSFNNSHSINTPLKFSTLLCAIMAGVGIGIQLISFDQAPSQSGVAPLIISRVSSVLLIYICYIGFTILQKKIPSTSPVDPSQKWKGKGLSISSGIFDSIASIAFVVAVHTGDLITAAVITALYPAGTVFLARLIFHEKLSSIHICGLILAGIAIVLLTI